MNDALSFLDKFLEGENYVAGKTLADLALVVTISNYQVENRFTQVYVTDLLKHTLNQLNCEREENNISTDLNKKKLFLKQHLKKSNINSFIIINYLQY